MFRRVRCVSAASAFNGESSRRAVEIGCDERLHGPCDGTGCADLLLRCRHPSESGLVSGHELGIAGKPGNGTALQPDRRK